MIERLSPPGSPPPKGHYSPAVRAGDFIFVSGQGPYDSQGQFSPGDIQHETKATLKNVQHILKGCGSGLEDVVKTSVFLADISEFAAFDKAYGEAFGATKPAPPKNIGMKSRFDPLPPRGIQFTPGKNRGPRRCRPSGLCDGPRRREIHVPEETRTFEIPWEASAAWSARSRAARRSRSARRVRQC